MKIYDEYIETVIQLAEDYMRDGDSQKAKLMLENALMEEPGYPKLHYTMGWLYEDYLVDQIMAERHYGLAIKFDPGYRDPYLYLTDLYLKRKQYNELRRVLNGAFNYDEIEDSFIYENLGKVEEAEGNYRTAIQFYKKALFHSMNNQQVKELKQNIKRSRFKRIKLSWKKWQQIK